MVKRWLGAVAILAVLLGGFLWWRNRGSTGAGPSDPSHAASSAADAKALAALRDAQAARGPVDLTPARLSGTVTDAKTGAPIAGATVYAARARGVAEGEGALAVGETDERHDLATTDAQGRFSLEGLAPGAWSVGASHVDHLPASTSVTLAAREDHTGVSLVLASGGLALSGQVTDVGGGALPGAIVLAAPLGLDGGITSAAVADAEGRYRLRLSPGGHRLNVSMPGYVTAVRVLDVSAGDAVSNFVLTPAATLAGRVVTAKDQAPVAGAVVTISGGRASSDEGRRFANNAPRQVRTDADGRFRVRGARPGTARVTATARGLATRAPLIVDVGIGEELVDLVLEVDRAPSIRGFVVREDQPTVGLPDVAVGAFTMSGGSPEAAVTDASGAFELHGLKPGHYMLFAQREGLEASIMRQSVDVADEDVNDVIVKVRAGATISGRVSPPGVVQLSLEPGGEVGLGNLSAMAAAGAVRAESKADGTFELRGVPAGSFKVVAESPRGARGATPVKVAENEQKTGVAIELQDQASLAGDVVDERGQPLAGVTVFIKAHKPGRGGGEAEVTIEAGKRYDRVTTDDRGRFRFDGLAAGAYVPEVRDHVGALPDPAAPTRPERAEITLAEREAKTGVRLVAVGLTGTISGRVVDPSGQPVADAWVTARFDDSGLRKIEYTTGDDGALARPTGPPALTDDAGRFTLTRLRANGNYLVAAEQGALRGESAKVAVGSQVTVVLTPLATLTGAVVQGGQPAPRYTLYLSGANTSSQSISATDGRFSLPRQRPGVTKVIARTTDGSASGEVTLVAGQSGHVDLVIAPLASVHGRLVDARSGKAIAGAMLITAADDGNGAQAEQLEGLLTGRMPSSDGDGRFELRNLTPGTYTLVAMDAGAAPQQLASHAFVVAAGERKDLGTIKGLAGDRVPAAEGGDLGFDVDTDKVPGHAMVSEILPGSPAAAAGLALGDELVAIDGLDASTVGVRLLVSLIYADRVRTGQVVEVKVKRGEAVLTFALTARPEP